MIKFRYLLLVITRAVLLSVIASLECGHLEEWEDSDFIDFVRLACALEHCRSAYCTYSISNSYIVAFVSLNLTNIPTALHRMAILSYYLAQTHLPHLEITSL